MKIVKTVNGQEFHWDLPDSQAAELLRTRPDLYKEATGRASAPKQTEAETQPDAPETEAPTKSARKRKEQ